MRHGFWCKKCVKSGEPSFWKTAARVTSRLIANNLPLLSAFMFVEQKVCWVWGTMVLTNSWVKDFARNREQSTYQRTGTGYLKASKIRCVFYWIFLSSIFIGHKKYIYSNYNQPTTFSVVRAEKKKKAIRLWFECLRWPAWRGFLAHAEAEC